MSDIAISVENLQKIFKVAPSPRARILEWASLGFLKYSVSVEAIRGISFDLCEGRVLGIIGSNGSGKTTLLRILAGLCVPSSGQIEISGVVGSILELGVIFHPDFTGKQNILLNGVLLGIPENDLKARYPEMAEFSELGKFLDLPIRIYSQGMVARLAFSLAIHIDPRILLIDEVMAVGDESFQQKCIQRLQEMKGRGVTIVVVSHNLPLIRGFCDEVIWLDKGALQEHGKPDDVIRSYLGSQRNTASPDGAPEHGERHGSFEAVLTRVAFIDREGHETKTLYTGKPARLFIEYDAHERVELPTFGFAIHRKDGVHVWGFATKGDGANPNHIEGLGRLTVDFPNISLLPGAYYLTAALLDNDSIKAIDFHSQMYPFTMKSTLPDEGILTMPHQYTFESF